MDNTELTMPWWQKYTLSIAEASKYFGIGDKKLRQFITEHSDEQFVLWNGTRPRIKRKLFEQYINEKISDI